MPPCSGQRDRTQCVHNCVIVPPSMVAMWECILKDYWSLIQQRPDIFPVT